MKYILSLFMISSFFAIHSNQNKNKFEEGRTIRKSGWPLHKIAVVATLIGVVSAGTNLTCVPSEAPFYGVKLPISLAPQELKQQRSNVDGACGKVKNGNLLPEAKKRDDSTRWNDCCKKLFRVLMTYDDEVVDCDGNRIYHYSDASLSDASLSNASLSDPGLIDYCKKHFRLLMTHGGKIVDCYGNRISDASQTTTSLGLILCILGFLTDW